MYDINKNNNENVVVKRTFDNQQAADEVEVTLDVSREIVTALFRFSKHEKQPTILQIAIRTGDPAARD